MIITDGNIEAMLCGYVDCALWSSTDNTTESGGYPLDDNYDRDDLTSEASAQMREDCADFARANAADALAYLEAGYDWEHFGYDFWLTRNRHGAGFWDRDLNDLGKRLSDAARIYGEVNLYVTDDGKVAA